MKTDSKTKKRKWTVLRTIIVSLIVILISVAILVYNNFNRILTRALINTFNSSVLSDVYELKFDNLRVNVFNGSIIVHNVAFRPLEKPAQNYPYINSSFQLTTKKLNLEHVEIFTLLKSSKLIVERISITKPDVILSLNGERHVMFPFVDTTAVEVPDKQKEKNSIGSFSMKVFQLKDASIHVTNSDKQREFKIRSFNISLNDLMVSQQPGKYLTSVNTVIVSIGALTGEMNKDIFKHLSFKDFKIGIDSLAIQYSLDTLVHRFQNINLGINDLDIQTDDSIFHIMMQSFDLSYADKSIKIKEVSFMPNVSHEVLQRKFKFQHTEFSGSIGTIDILQVNFDSLIYAHKLFIDQVEINQVKAYIFKDKTKPIDTNKKPAYLGQTVASIPLPLLIKQVKATQVYLENTERKPDSTIAKVNITNANIEVNNITNLARLTNLEMHADAFIEDKAHVTAALFFSYKKPEFRYEASVKKFNLPDLNPLIEAYTPARINAGTVDKISFSGVGWKTKAQGTMNFLYHDLVIDMTLPDQAKWKNSVIAFTANSLLNSSNPVSASLPPKVVKFEFERDVNKGFVNVLIKSLLSGLKETMFMSKENRKEYKKNKK
jgi:hypothetical protein